MQQETPRQSNAGGHPLPYVMRLSMLWHPAGELTLEQVDNPLPLATLSELRRLLAPGGQLVVADFARREPVFLWSAFEWLLHQIEGSPVHAYTLAEAQSLYQQAGLHVAVGDHSP